MERIHCQKTIAEKLNLSQSAVSLALRNKPGVSEATRAKVLQMAEELGYVPDPLLSSLSDYRKKVRPASFRSVIAYLHYDEKLSGHNRASPWLALLESAKAEAAKRGFRIEPLWLGDPNMSVEHLFRVMQTRGINAVILAPSAGSTWINEIATSPFCAVALGTYNQRNLPIDHVSTDHYQNARILASEIEALGYKRVGVCLAEDLDSVLMRQYSSFFVRLQTEQDRSAKWNIFRYDSSGKGSGFSAWMDTFRPDALVFQNEMHYKMFAERLSCFAGAFDHGKNVGLLCISHSPEANTTQVNFSGIDEQPKHVGTSAIELVVGLLASRAAEQQSFPRRLLIEGTWKVGGTLTSQCAP